MQEYVGGKIMDSFMEMGTSLRHNEIITELLIAIANLIKQRREIRIWHENCSLIYSGKRAELDTLSLIDVGQIKDVKSFAKNAMSEFRRVEPDFMLFDKNAYIENDINGKPRTRVAGFPDLVIEIWSEANLIEERKFKKFLYSTSPITEHWYINQESNNIECFLGQNALTPQSLKNILRTQNGVEFDLRYMAI
jgi:Uma2 family endonuclease